MMTLDQLKELHELSPEPVYDGKDYFDAEELKKEQELERVQNAKLRQVQEHEIHSEK